MPAVVIVGAQLGDEGKGKITDLYADKADMVVRFNGGANAGHTLVADGKKVITHLIPSGVMRPHITCVLGEGMVIDPLELVQEIVELKKSGFLTDDKKLLIARGAHLVLPHHKELDAAREGVSNVIGTTKKGIGPAYESKFARRGVRMADLLVTGKLEDILEGAGVLDQYTSPQLNNLLMAGDFLAKHFADVSDVVNDSLDSKKNVIIEGAQAALLDIDHGNYPFVSSSSSTAGGACASLGIGPKRIDCVIGVAKAYTTAVGRMPFPTEMDEATGNLWREAGKEYGSTTGRPRRIGWLDLPALKKAIRINGIDQMAWVKLDVFLHFIFKYIATGYYPSGAPILEKVRFSQPRQMIDFLTAELGINPCLYSYGPDREKTKVLFHPFE